MKRRLNKLTATAALLIVTLLVLASVSPPVQRTVDFTHSNNLKEIFDAGLKPWRLQGLESFQCELGVERLKIVLPENCSFTLEIERADILVLAGNQLSSVELNCPQMAYVDAAKQVAEICRTAGISTTEFDEYVDGLGKNIRRPFLHPLIAKKGGVELHVIYKVAPIYPPPSARISVTLTWAQPNGIMKFLTGPIQPPPGYENVSMDPPPDRSAKNITTATGVNSTQARGALQQQLNNSSSTSAPMASTESQPKTSGESSSQNPWLTPKFSLWALVLIAAALLGFYASRRK